MLTSRTLNRLKWWVCAIWAIWLILAAVTALGRATCGMPWEAACLKSGFEGLGDVVLLRWVPELQDLLAGLAALAGGGFVIYATTMQITANERLQTNHTKDAIRSALALGRAEFIHASDILRKETLKPNATELVFVRSKIDLFALLDARLLHILVSALYRTEDALKERLRGSASSWSDIKFTWYGAYAMAFAEILDQVGEKLEAGTMVKLGPATLDGEALYKWLKQRHLDPRHIFELGPYFKWPNEHVERDPILFDP